MGPYFWNGIPTNGPYPYGYAAGLIPLLTPKLDDLPEEVKEALENHKDDINSAADIRDITNDLMLRR